jgi:hypothetical protein
VRSITHLHPTLRSIMSGNIPLLPNTPSWCKQGKLFFILAHSVLNIRKINGDYFLKQHYPVIL